MNLRVREWGAKKAQGACWILGALLLFALSYYDATYRYIWLVVGIVMIWYGQKLLKAVETPFERHQREQKRTQL